MDCKAHRTSKVLEIRSLHIESDVDGDFIDALNAELQGFVKFNGCQQVEVKASSAGNLARQIKPFESEK